MKTNYTAIDFETANGNRHSICQIGLARFVNGIVTEQLSILVQPPDNYYWDRFTVIHGITAEQTIDAPTFDKVWHLVEQFIKNQEVVAHNGHSFDFVCLTQTLEYYGLEIPEYTRHCTYQLFRKNLAALCEEHGIPLDHHDALSDARACGELFRMHLNK